MHVSCTRRQSGVCTVTAGSYGTCSAFDRTVLLNYLSCNTMRTFSDRLIGRASQCYINLRFLYGQDHAVCVLGLVYGAVGAVVLLVMALISAFLFLVPKFRLGKQECVY